MKKRVSRKTRTAGTARKIPKSSQANQQAVEYISNLIKLHKLQGSLLGRLNKLLR